MARPEWYLIFYAARTRVNNELAGLLFRDSI